MGVKFTVNSRQLGQELRQSLAKKNPSRVLEQNIKLDRGKTLEKKVEEMIDDMIREFISMPITKEILGGKNSSNISGTLGGYGNLFSFIGFPEGSQPIDPIIELLQQTSYNLTGLTPRGTMKLTITLPSPADIFRITPLPWAPGISWAQRIEVGLSGLGMYMDKSAGRSGGGIQTSRNLRKGRFSNAPYVSSFLKDWQKKFLKIDKAVSLK
tara:strand:+ start:1654 stop:2286 length:633 start_codon:yes stop_codon:yes gene_type:complete